MSTTPTAPAGAPRDALFDWSAYLTTREVAAFFAVSPDYIRKLRRDGILIPVVLPSGDLLFRRSEIEAYGRQRAEKRIHD